MDYINTITTHNLRDGIPLPDAVVDCVVTSPPYWMQRDYGFPEQLGMEATVEEYIENQVKVFMEVHRVMKKEATLWLNIADTYASNSPRNEGYTGKNGIDGRGKRKKGIDAGMHPATRIPAGHKPKDLVGIPWLLAFALRDAGAYDVKACRLLERVMAELVVEYALSKKRVPDKVLKVMEKLEEEYRQAKGSSFYLRQDIIWHKPNPMPESMRDRCTKSHEYVFLLSKSKEYYYDQFAIATPLQEKTYTTYGTKPKGYGDGSGLIASENWHARVQERKPKEWKTPDGWDTKPGGHGSIHREGREKGRKGERQEGV